MSSLATVSLYLSGCSALSLLARFKLIIWLRFYGSPTTFVCWSYLSKWKTLFHSHNIQSKIYYWNTESNYLEKHRVVISRRSVLLCFQAGALGKENKKRIKINDRSIREYYVVRVFFTTCCVWVLHVLDTLTDDWKNRCHTRMFRFSNLWMYVAPVFITFLK